MQRKTQRKMEQKTNTIVRRRSEGKRRHMQVAAVTVLIAVDMAFYDKLPQLAPHTAAASCFAGSQPLIAATVMNNSARLVFDEVCRIR